MWELISQKSIYRRTYKGESQPAGLEGIVVDLGGYDASERLRYCKTVKYI